AFGAAPDGMAILDGSGVLVYLNDAHARIYGYEGPQDLEGKPWTVLYHDDELRRFKADVQPTLARSGRWQGEAVGKKQDGSRFPQDVSLTRLADGGLVCVVRDLTERKQGQQALRQSEAKYRQIFEDTSDAITIIEPETERILEVNQEATLTYGRPREELIGASLKSFTYDVARGEKQIVELLRGGTCRDFETIHLRKDGTPIPLVVNASVIEYEGKAAILSVNRDVSRARRAEEALRESERRFREIVETANEGIWVVDPEGNTGFVNPRMGEILGYSTEEMAGKTLFDFMDEAGLALAQTALDDLPPGATSRHQLRFRRKDGSELWALVSTSPVTDRGGRYAGVVNLIADISDHKRSEEALRQAQKLESLGVLAGGVAHDFNNLLAVILGQNSLALGKLPPGHGARGNLEKAITAVNRAADLAGKMLSYSGKGHFEIKQLDLSALIREGQSLYQAAVPKNVSLVLDLPDDLPPVDADAGQIRQVLMSLILNGAEAIGEAAGTVRVTTGTAKVGALDEALWRHTGQPLAPGRYVSVEVRDNGGGMDAETIPRIFDPFFSTKFVGRGLGLAATLGVVRGHQGGIRVESVPGQGSVFTLVFPLAKAARAAAPRPTGRPRSGAILVVDDEAVLREVVREVLETEGYPVWEASEGQEALDLFAPDPSAVALVLLDLSMPGMGGEEAFKHMRQLDPEVQVVLTSGFSEAEATRHFGGLGLAGFIQKPYAIPDLLSLIRCCLGTY
ncbi:MAG TPA: PAS domain S-box protein, partial [Vicinamibacteria bacterium]|nr:PAS domain S-box protein [Vicinamibacteria bacterium]